MLKNLSLTLKLALMPAVALLGLLLYVGYNSQQLSNNDSRLVELEPIATRPWKKPMR